MKSICLRAACVLSLALCAAISFSAEVPSWTFGAAIVGEAQKAQPVPDWRFEVAASKVAVPSWDFKADTQEAPAWSFAVDTANVKEPVKPATPKPPACKCPECECCPNCKCCEAENDLRYAEAFDLARKQGKGVVLSIGQPANVRAAKRLEAKIAGKVFASEDFPPSVNGIDLHAGLYDWGPPAQVVVESAKPVSNVVVENSTAFSQSMFMQPLLFGGSFSGNCPGGNCATGNCASGNCSRR